MLRKLILASVSVFAFASLAPMPAAALTMKECSVKYQAAKKANTLKGQKWNDFRKAQCGDDDAGADEAAAAVPRRAGRDAREPPLLPDAPGRPYSRRPSRRNIPVKPPARPG